MYKDQKYGYLKRNIATYFLLICTVFFFIFSPNSHHIHDALHKHEGVACSIEIENDPCHQRIFHNQASLGCDHDVHIHSPKESCELCDAILHTIDINKVDFVFIQKPTYKENNTPYSRQDFTSNSTLSNHVRGPPSLKLT